jgi:hypothetical protein
MQDLLVKQNTNTQLVNKYNNIINFTKQFISQYNNLLNIVDEKESKEAITLIQNNNQKIVEYYTNKINEINVELNKINNEILQLQNPNECKTIHELYRKIENINQKMIFGKILNDTEYAKIYLSGYEENKTKTGKNKDTLGTIKVLGTLNSKKQEREEYDIKLFSNSEKGTFWCSCPDHKFNSSKKGTVCKHICFIVCKIMKILRPSFFVDKKLTSEEIEKLITKLTTSNIWTDASVVQKLQKITLETFMNFTKELDEDDSCPICYENMDPNKKDLLLACPACHNYVHRECNDVWMEKHNECVYCRNDIWTKYKKLK